MQRSPSFGLLIGLAITLAAVVADAWYVSRQVSGLQLLQTELIDRNRKDSLQLLRIQSDLNQLSLAMRDMRCTMAFGVMGADYQPMGHAHLVTNMVDYGMDVQAAIDSPRMFFEGETTEVERGVPAATIEGLKARGHNVAFRPLPLGGGQAIVIDWERGVLIGGSDPRKDGLALGY